MIDTIIAGHTHRPVYENLSLTERMYLEGRRGNMAGGRAGNLARKYGDTVPKSGEFARKYGDTKCDRAGNAGTRSQILSNLGHVPVFPRSCPRISSDHVTGFRMLSSDRAYYNTGSCVHPRCITGIEITTGKDEKPAFSLIKWGYTAACAEATPESGCGAYTLTIQRQVLSENKC